MFPEKFRYLVLKTVCCCGFLALTVNTYSRISFSEVTDKYSPTGMIGVLTAIITIVVFIFRERRIRVRYKKLQQKLDERFEEISKQEKQIRKQKEILQKQIDLSEEQNQLVHKQAIELEKHRHSLEKTVKFRNSELIMAKEKAEESDRLKTAFLENISHEIRTPMNAIIGFSSLLESGELTPGEQEKYILRINKNCNVLLHLIDGILDVAKIQTGQLSIAKKTFSVNKFLNQVFQEYMEEHKESRLHNISIELDLPPDREEFRLYSDPLRIRQVLQNMLSNAIKFTENGKIRCGYIPLYDSSYKKEPSALQFYIEDTGIGISADKAEFIFRWFNKIEDDNSKIYRGAGLGLYLSKEIVTLLGGKIWFNSKVKEGSTFYFTLPFLNTDEIRSTDKDEQGRKRKESSDRYNWKNKTILIVEDEINNSLYLSEIIRKTEAKVIEASNGLEAIKIIDSGEEISLVLMDIMMPLMDGYEATRKIKTIRPQLPVIAQTAYSKARENEKCLEAGCEGYINKPYDPQQLLRLLNNFL
jgi:signal transduction histidine kinase